MNVYYILQLAIDCGFRFFNTCGSYTLGVNVVNQKEFSYILTKNWFQA